MMRPWIPVLWVILAAAALAQDDAPTPAPETAPAEEQSRPAPTAPEAETPVAPPATTGARAKSPDAFVPSEEISEDLSVSFPVDI